MCGKCVQLKCDGTAKHLKKFPSTFHHFIHAFDFVVVGQRR